MKMWGGGCSAVKCKMFFITVETKALNFIILKAFCVRELEKTFCPILKLTNVCLNWIYKKKQYIEG
jgi:hypothetical protein